LAGLSRPENDIDRRLNKKMISRIWHGWTTPHNADEYEALLKEEIFVGILNRHIPGFRGIQLLRRFRKKARAILSRFDQRSQHYEIRADRIGGE
jgi:heme-degrading monooxygenase HmoA